MNLALKKGEANEEVRLEVKLERSVGNVPGINV
jgi:hypothetical protein